MTTLTFGGNGVSFTKINNQFSVMTGGRCSATLNNRYTIGGGGWGMIKGFEVESNTEGINNFVKWVMVVLILGISFQPGRSLHLEPNF